MLDKGFRSWLIIAHWKMFLTYTIKGSLPASVTIRYRNTNGNILMHIEIAILRQRKNKV